MSTEVRVPHKAGLHSLRSFLQNGYLFIANTDEAYKTDIFETNLLGQKVLFIKGEEAAKMFYNNEKLIRNGAAPKRVQKTLTGLKAIQTLDGEEHLKRKNLFLSLTTPDNQVRLSEITRKKWIANIDLYISADKIVLFDEAKHIYCSAACDWAGVPLKESEARMRAEDFISMVDAFAAFGKRHRIGKIARRKTEDWIRGLIDDTRAGKLKPGEGSALNAFAFYTDHNGKQLVAQTAAVELINIIRPIVAISVFITFAATALFEHQEYKEIVTKGNDNQIQMFLQEVRRYYPFAPFVGAKVKKDFTWNQHDFQKGELVILDIYGTDHDDRIWDNPDEFRPERFIDWKSNLFDLIPQGGGNSALGHRCPGEGITIGLMKETLRFMYNDIEFDVPDQDLSYDLSTIPTLPKSRFIMSNIRRI